MLKVSKCLLDEHAFIRNRDSDLFFPWDFEVEIDYHNNLSHNIRGRFAESFYSRELLVLVLLVSLFLTVVRLELTIVIDRSFHLLMFQIERFHYNMRCRTKDNLIPEDFYNHFTRSQNWQMSHLAALSLSLILSKLYFAIKLNTWKDFRKKWLNGQFSKIKHIKISS